MILETVVVGDLEANCYILAQSRGKGAIIIDPGDEEDKIRQVLKKFDLHPALIINTHGHADHIGADDKFKVTVFVHKLDLVLLRSPELNFSSLLGSPYEVSKETGIKALDENDIIEFEGIKLRVIHVPGHSPGGMSLFLDNGTSKFLFTGDSLFYRTIGRTDFPGGDEALLVRSIKEKLLRFPDNTFIYPGHGPSTTVGEEKKHNPFLA